MSLRSLFFALVFLISLPVHSYEVYKVTPPYESCSCEPATIHKRDGKYSIEYKYGDRYFVRSMTIESYDLEAQTLRIRIGSDEFEVAILEDCLM